MSIIITSIKDLPETLKFMSGELNIEKTDKVKESMAVNETKDKYLNPDSKIIEATPEIAALVDDLNKIEQLKGKLLDAQENLKLKVMNYMQFNNKLSFNDKYLVSWKNVNRTFFDLKAFKTEYPEMYELYQKDITSRIFKLY